MEVNMLIQGQPALITGLQMVRWFHCFDNIKEEEKLRLLSEFNDLENKNEQDPYLSSLISVRHIARRLSWKPDDQKRKDHSAAFLYKVRKNGKDCPVCGQAFISLHGITKGRVYNIQQSLLAYGKSPKDHRGKHDNRPIKYPSAIHDITVQHIQSFHVRSSHYSLRDNPDRKYLPESLTISKMHDIHQLWHNVFGVHDLGNDSVTMFTYQEGDGRKDSNEVTSMLLTYINSNDEPLDNLVLISDNCCRQNKNQTMDFSLIDKTKQHIESVELPEEWDSAIQEARKKPSPISVVNMHYRDFVNMKAVTDDYFLKSPKPPLKIKSARMFYITEKDFYVRVRDTYHGP
ncbi:hypothetical protein PR048_007328 [Dryococelus australis]|uniref:Uncharacterized protein n=1 Tax=Dryococelus australis TaxID=614101 RepID=A0ABQ9IDA9_9NEOP|nr:hypothetical protein PR048_007328 [Dryococelus australis]